MFTAVGLGSRVWVAVGNGVLVGVFVGTVVWVAVGIGVFVGVFVGTAVCVAVAGGVLVGVFAGGPLTWRMRKSSITLLPPLSTFFEKISKVTLPLELLVRFTTSRI